MISVASIYDDVRDNINTDENGDLNIALFNRLSRRAELRLIDWLSGDVAGQQLPMPDYVQKNEDFLAPFVSPYKKNVEGGYIDRPEDFYTSDSLTMLGSYSEDTDCEKPVPVNNCNTPIDLISRFEFDERCRTFIDGLEPSLNKPIAKMVGKKIYFAPEDIGSVVLNYVRVPKFGKIVVKIDQIFNNEVPDPDNSDDYEWDESARESLLWFITDTFSIHSREQALKLANQATGKTVRDGK